MLNLYYIVNILFVLTTIGGAIYAIIILNRRERERQSATIKYMKTNHNLDIVFDNNGNMIIVDPKA